MRTDFERLFDATARLVGAPDLSDRATGDAFVDMMKSLFPFDYCVIFAYRGAERPIDLYSTFDAAEYQVFVSMYQDGPYLLDPFYSAATQPRPGVWRMRALAPDRFFASEYCRSYYVQTGLAEEVGFFVPAGDGVTVVLSLMRREGSGIFRDAEYALMRKAEPVVAAMVHAVWSRLGPRFDHPSRAHREDHHPEAKARARISDRLTQREAAIIELVLQGHSSESIGLRLGVATGTVKVHRRNIYRKLGISSQAQLMSLYLGRMKAPQ
ncbi:MAG: helix-turn-helix transcriptional regulator [Rhizobiaceae bacterium]|nr:helix-turn-helix transcriptional regulator [Rhizobiaceae bacterium]